MYNTLDRCQFFLRRQGLVLVSLLIFVGFLPVQADILAEGKSLAFSRTKGNCLACHMMDDGTLTGNGGPALIAMKSRFPDIKVLRAQIWDSTTKNPNTIMPPFGRHGILSDEEIDKITAYVHSL